MSLNNLFITAVVFLSVTVSVTVGVTVSAPLAAAAPTAKPVAKPEKEKEKAKEKEKDGDKVKVKDATGLKQVFQESPTEQGGPLYVKSDTLQLDSKSRVFTYKGNVEVVRSDVTITGNTVEGHYDSQNKLETIIAIGNVVITKGESMRSTANRAVYNVAAATIELTEGPELYRDGNALAADKVTMFIDEDRSEAEGNVRVKVVKPEETGQ